MHAAHFTAGAWTLMVHGIVAPLYDWQGGPRGDDQLNVTNWGMLAALRPLGGGRIALRVMASADPWTVGAKGYPRARRRSSTAPPPRAIPSPPSATIGRTPRTSPTGP